MERRQLHSDSDVIQTTTKISRRESVSEYLTSRRGSLSDLVFTTHRKLSRDSILACNNRHTRHLSLTNRTPPSTSRDSHGRAGSLTTSGPLGSVRESRLETRSQGNATGTSGPEKRKLLLKTTSLSSFLSQSNNDNQTKKALKNPIFLRRKKWLKKIQSLQAFDSALKSSRLRRSSKPPIVRFRRAVKIVQLLLKATGNRRHSQQHDHVSWTQIADEQSTARRSYDLFGISFDPSIFKARREKSLGNEAKAILCLDPSNRTEDQLKLALLALNQTVEKSLGNEAKAILCLDPSHRTEDQLKLALLALNQTVEAFGEFPIKLQRSLASVGWYENFEAKRVIIRQGHMADNFYFILSGTAIVTILETNKDTGEQSIRTVAFLRKGNSFGELALMHGARRSATVTCKTNVELLAVSREDFIDIFMHIEKDKEPEHIEFLRSIDLFRGWPIERLPHDNPRICLFTFFRRGVLLCKDSNTTDWIYIIKTGTCRVLKDLCETKPNIKGLEVIPYTQRQTYVKLPPIPVAKPAEVTSHCRRRHSLIHSNGYKTGYQRLPSIHRSLEQDFMSTEEHLKQINDIYDKRHKVMLRDRHIEESSIKSDKERPDPSKVFVQIQKLGPRDVFGLEQSVFGMISPTTGCSLVSDGAECILINKKFFVQHLTDDVAKEIRRMIQLIPTEESLQQKLQDQTNWDAYKSMTVANLVVFKKQIHDHELDAALYY